MKNLILLIGLASLFMKIEARTYCGSDTHCSYLGKLYCMKGQCDYGICGCPRGKVSKFLGSEGMFECVPLKKVGEKCSADSNTGVCGAPNSVCDGGYCRCIPTYVQIWGGEYCASNSQQRTLGESCSGSVGNCQLTTASCLGAASNRYAKDEIKYSPRSCACGINQKIWLPNDVTMHDFIGKKVPLCRPVRIGEYCWHKSQCPNNAVCTSNKCACDTGFEQVNVDGTQCATATPIGFGQICSGTGDLGTCNGALGLTCGDDCDLNDPNGVLADVKLCAYAPYWPSGSEAVVGTGCFGDHNCFSVALGNGICTSNTCENAGVRVGVSLTALILVITTVLMMQ